VAAKKKTTKKEGGKRRRYGPAEKTIIVALALDIGVRLAARKHGVAQSTVWRWVKERRDSEAAQRDDGDRPDGAATTSDGEVPPPPRPGRPARRYTPSERATILEDAAATSVIEAAKKHGVSRFSIYDWRRKLRLAAKGEGEAPTSGPDPADVEAKRDREILAEWRRNPGLGPSQIRNQLRRRGIKVAVNTVRRVMEEEGYLPHKVKRRLANLSATPSSAASSTSAASGAGSGDQAAHPMRRPFETASKPSSPAPSGPATAHR